MRLPVRAQTGGRLPLSAPQVEVARRDPRIRDAPATSSRSVQSRPRNLCGPVYQLLTRATKKGPSSVLPHEGNPQEGPATAGGSRCPRPTRRVLCIDADPASQPGREGCHACRPNDNSDNRDRGPRQLDRADGFSTRMRGAPRRDPHPAGAPGLGPSGTARVSRSARPVSPDPLAPLVLNSDLAYWTGPAMLTPARGASTGGTRSRGRRPGQPRQHRQP